MAVEGGDALTRMLASEGGLGWETAIDGWGDMV